jgi:hypothetical protein
MPSFRGALPVRMVIIGTIMIIVPLDTLFLFHALFLSVPVFDPTACISAMDGVVQLMVVPTTPSDVLLQWSDDVGWVPVGTMPVVKLVTAVSILIVVDQIYHNCCLQHHMQALDMHVDFFIIFGQMGVIWSMSIFEARTLWASVR